MTIDEFKKNIAPYMNKGYVAMDIFTIRPVEDWTKSLIEVGK